MGLLKPLRNFQIRHKLLICYSVVFIAASALGGFAMNSSLKNTILSNMESNLRSSTHALRNMVRASVKTALKNHLWAILEKHLEVAQHYYNQSVWDKLSEEDAKNWVKAIITSQRIGRSGYMYCIDGQGILVAHPQKELEGKNFSEDPFIKKQIENPNSFIESEGAAPFEEEKRTKAVYMAYFTPWDWIITAIAFEDEFQQLVNVADFRNSILALKFGKTGYPYIMDTKGNLIIHPTMEGQNVYDLEDGNQRKFIREMCLKKSGRIQYPWQNPGEARPREKLVMYEYIPELDWVVVSSSYLDELNEPLRQVRNLIYIFIVVCLIMLIPITLFIGNQVTKPLSDLIRDFRENIDGVLSVRIIGHSSRDETGTLARYFNSFMEKLESYHDKLRTSEERYRSIFEGSVEGIYQIDPHGSIIRANTSFASMLGYGSPEALVKEVKDIAGQLYVDLTRRREIEGLIAEHGVVKNFEMRMYRKDGAAIWVSLSERSVKDHTGNIVYYEGFLSDRTRHKLAEEELRKSEERYRAVLQGMSEPFITYDVMGRATYINDAFTRVFGWTREELIGKRVDFIPEECIEETQTALNEVYEGIGYVNAFETKRRTKSGKIIDVSVSAALYRDADGTPAGIVVILQDIRVRRKAEEALKEAHDLLESRVIERTAALREANTKIMDSIQYAQTIQQAILPKIEWIADSLSGFFILWKPKDVLSGDFFWFEQCPEGCLIAAIDCTGHGVPGAIMTMIAHTALQHVVNDMGLDNPAKILAELNRYVKGYLNQQETNNLSDDGFDIGICKVNEAEKHLTFAGARIKLFYSENGSVKEIHGDRQSIGYRSSDVNYRFTNHTVPVNSGQRFYITTDGLVDQVGGEKGFPFGKSRFIRFIAAHDNFGFGEQRALLEERIEQYQGEEPQRDDITVVGFTV